MEMFNKTVELIDPQSTVIYGLKFFPSLEPVISNNRDEPTFGWPNGPEVSDCNLLVVSDALAKLGTSCRSILEIGVHRNNNRSMSSILIDNKPNDCIYLGVDLDDKSYIDNPIANVHTLISNSHDHRKVRSKLTELGVEKIDLLFIDGWHSVNTCVNDWCYTDLLSDHGVVILHDTNAHPGPIALFHAVDELLFKKERYCAVDTDMGIAVLWHKK